jgi:hypothetical protein
MRDDDDDFEGDEVDDLPTGFVFYREVEAVPITKFTFVHFILTIITGFLRTLLEATANLGDAVVGAEGYARNKKDFEDEARLAMETIAEGPEDDS